MDGNSSRARGWLPHRTEATRSCPRRRRTALLRRWLRRADGWPEACVGLRRRSVLGPRRRRGCPNRDGATPVGSGGRGKGRPSPRRGGRRRVRRGRRICGGSIRRESGGRREEHREKVPWCFHHAPTESFPHLSPPAGLKRKLRVPAQKVALSIGGDPFASGWFSSLSQGRSPERIAIYILRTFLLVEDVPSGELERLGRGKAGAPPPRRRVPPLLLHLTP